MSNSACAQIIGKLCHFYFILFYLNHKHSVVEIYFIIKWLKATFIELRNMHSIIYTQIADIGYCIICKNLITAETRGGQSTSLLEWKYRY